MDEQLLRHLNDEKIEMLNCIVKLKMRDLINKRIMVVDDCPNTLKIIRKFLEEIPKVDVYTFQDEIQAMKHFVDDPPDVVVLDMQLN